MYKVNKTICCVTELMDHVIEESIKIYADTDQRDTFLIFHDGLSAWWEGEAQTYLAEQGFAHRQLRALGDTYARTR